MSMAIYHKDKTEKRLKYGRYSACFLSVIVHGKFITIYRGVDKGHQLG